MERLRTFCEVADAGSMAKAAGGDVVRQSQFSRQIKELEEHFGRKLTERVGRNVVLTAEGWELAALGRQILAGLESFHGESDAAARDTVILGAGESFLRGVVLPRLPEIQIRMPRVLLEMRNLRGQETVEALEEGRIDLGVIEDEAARAGIEMLRLGRVTYRLIAWSEGRAESSDWRAILGRPFIVLGGGENWESKVATLAAKAGKGCEIAVRCASWHAVVDAVRVVKGAAFVPSIVETPSDCRDIDTPKLKMPERSLALAWNSRRGDLRTNSAQWRRVLGELLRLS